MCIAKVQCTVFVRYGSNGEITVEITVNLRGVISFGLKAGKRVYRLVFGPLTILDIKLVLEKAKTSSRQAADVLFARKELLQHLMVGDDCEAL